MSFDTLPQLCIPGWNQAGLCEWIESPSRERIYSYCFSLHILLSEDNKSAIGFAETTLTTAKEFRPKVDEGKALACLKQPRASPGSRERSAAVCEGPEPYCSSSRGTRWAAFPELTPNHGSFLLLWQPKPRACIRVL